MTIAAIQAALESRLNGISPAIATAWPNVAFTPAIGTPWQRVRLMINNPIDHAVSLDITEQRGLLEIILHYPLGAGAATANARAQAVATRFTPPQTLTSGGTNVEILTTPHIAGGIALDDWWAVPITVQWRSFS
jgi:hypothetical protein